MPCEGGGGGGTTSAGRKIQKDAPGKKTAFPRPFGGKFKNHPLRERVMNDGDFIRWNRGKEKESGLRRTGRAEKNRCVEGS